MPIIDCLIEKINECKNPTVVGIDTTLEYLPEEMQASVHSLSDAAKVILQFNKNLIDSIYDIVPAVKVQVAYYEQYGHYGIETFEETIRYAKKRGLITIADVKRNDIGPTSKAYSKSYLSAVDINDKKITACDCDFITVNAYLGSDGILPFVEDCKNNNKGIFVLVKTSNPSGSEIQNLKVGEKFIYEIMADMCDRWGSDLVGKYGYSSIGAVVGATHRDEIFDIRKKHKNLFFLIPGYGAQGGKAEDLALAFDENGVGGIVNSSRAIICAYKEEKYKGIDIYQAARLKALEMKEDLNANIKGGYLNVR